MSRVSAPVLARVASPDTATAAATLEALPTRISPEARVRLLGFEATPEAIAATTLGEEDELPCPVVGIGTKVAAPGLLL